jgi:hypothetical protein
VPLYLLPQIRVSHVADNHRVTLVSAGNFWKGGACFGEEGRVFGEENYRCAERSEAVRDGVANAAGTAGDEDAFSRESSGHCRGVSTSGGLVSYIACSVRCEGFSFIERTSSIMGSSVAQCRSHRNSAKQLVLS